MCRIYHPQLRQMGTGVSKCGFLITTTHYAGNAIDALAQPDVLPPSAVTL